MRDWGVKGQNLKLTENRTLVQGDAEVGTVWEDVVCSEGKGELK
jgi:hypothetical protein